MQRPGIWLSLLLLVFAVQAAAEGNHYALVKARSSLSLRKEAKTSAARLESLKTHEPVKVVERKGEWARVESTAGNVGWVLSSYLSKNAFVSVDVSSVSAEMLNVRRGPGTKYTVIFKAAPHYPLRVLDRVDAGSSSWLMVMDFEGDLGWISSKLVSTTSYVITNLDSCNLRSGPDKDDPVLFVSERAVLFEVVEEKNGWLRVQHADKDEGWISANIVFGWNDVEPPDQD